MMFVSDVMALPPEDRLPYALQILQDIACEDADRLSWVATRFDVTPATRRLKAQLVVALRDHLRGRRPAPPFAGVALWQAFAALSDARRWSDGMPDPLQASEVEAWARLTGAALPRHHVQIIAALDAAWLEWMRTPEAERVAGPMTGAVFDAMFG